MEKSNIFTLILLRTELTSKLNKLGDVRVTCSVRKSYALKYVFKVSMLGTVTEGKYIVIKNTTERSTQFTINRRYPA